MAVIFAFSQFTVVDAKARSGGSFSSGSRSISKSSGGFSGSSSSKSIGGSLSGSSKSTAGSSAAKSSGSSGFSGSSTSRSLPNSYSSGSSSSSKSTAPSAATPGSSSSGYSGSGSGSKSAPASGSPSGSSSSPKPAGGASQVKSKTDTMKNTYMAEEYKKQASQTNYNQYKQKLNDEQKKAYDSSFNKSYTVNNRMDFDYAMRTRPSRISVFSTRPIIVSYNPVYFSGPFSYGHAFVGPWDMWFLMRASDLFWYHHWHDITPYRSYFQEAQFRDMERRVQELEKKYNSVRDPNYLDPDVDPDLQFSGEYQQQNVDKIYYSDRYAKPISNPVPTLFVLALMALALIIILRKVSRPRSRNNYNSRIY